MKGLLLASLILLSGINLKAQNCANTSVGYPPIADLGTNYWRGFQGGLYSNGSNYRPAAHNLAGLNIAQNIQPLDTAGNVDLINGKIVWLSIGMSNTTMETQFFLPMTDTFSQKNPKLVLVDGAQGGQDIVIIDNPNANFWKVINNRLINAGLTYKQVQVIWFLEAEKIPSDTAFVTYPDGLKIRFKTALQIEKNKFPNTKLAYLSNRIYGGYATTHENPEPYAYYSGWSVKRLIEDQVNGDTSLTYTGANPRVPWLAWGANLWADGITPRSDGLTWICPTDFNNDGTHPSNPYGRQKVANLLFNFFTTDSTSIPWFLNQTSTGINNLQKQNQLKIFPNPANSVLTISADNSLGQISIYNLLHENILNLTTDNKEISMDVSSLSKGIYFIKTTGDKNSIPQKLIIQ
ncbi:MAG: T9SS type A sorting domain-containing protein [Saprospiraceae bacterium]